MFQVLALPQRFLCSWANNFTALELSFLMWPKRSWDWINLPSICPVEFQFLIKLTRITFKKRGAEAKQGWKTSGLNEVKQIPYCRTSEPLRRWYELWTFRMRICKARQTYLTTEYLIVFAKQSSFGNTLWKMLNWWFLRFLPAVMLYYKIKTPFPRSVPQKGTSVV